MGFKNSHPALNFAFFAAVAAFTLGATHPVFILISFITAFIYSLMLNGKKAALFNLALLPLIAMFTAYYASYKYFGETVLFRNSIGNAITLEAASYGMVLAFSVAAVLIWASCMNCVFSTDKAINLFSYASPKLGMHAAMLFRMVPRIKQEAKRINLARTCIGRGVAQGNIIRRLINCMSILSMLITWALEAIFMAGESLKSRGGGLKGRTAFFIYPFDTKDRMFTLIMFSCIALTLMAAIMGSTKAVYDPRIILSSAGSISCVFYAGFAVLCCMPIILEICRELSFWLARRRA